MPRKAKDAPKTTTQALGSLLKSARDIMRKDKGLNGDLDRLPLLTWIMFLKFLDDLERQREDEATLSGKKFRPAIDPPYRWRDWAINPQGITGDELLAFINQDEAIRPDATKGAGLFAYLRQLTNANGDDRREVIATVFKGVDNRMKSGYLLRDVINKVSDIHFTSSEELHTLGALYESMLREMRDAAGDSGEFYTPRAVVRFMVAVTDPQLGETVLDPASGTGGFLVEAYNHLAAQVKTVQDRKTLQERSLLGCEPKSLPYLLCQMNLLLHGLNAPQIDPHNALRFKLTEIGEKDRVDVILTNPPFGGEEEKGIQGNFPDDRQTAETALLFLQLIMRKLHRQPTSVGRTARAAVIVPNGTLFGDGVCGRIKEELLKSFNLHTIVRLPQGVFAPYTDIPANLLFFEAGGPTRDIWYYELPLPEGRKKYSKTAPLQFEEFAPVLDWLKAREEGPQAWKVDFAAKRATALESATPLWEKAEAERSSSASLSRSIRELEQQLATAIGSTGDRPASLRDLKRQQQAHDQAARTAQAEGDVAYWPIYNLDLKNPNTRAGLEHANPKALVASMRSQEAEVMRLLSEIEKLVAEVEA
ncbi:type I restriction-modification system subunit M [Geothrix terrae]|uniref:type I restriction-modification system subunit M n=1 Tax=Geothrix terrae TaxID=2922720 RepID=UPI001FAB3C6A|nr:class I SAM-dependent DNA methyltransferase [Geothrix terrae]